MKLYSYFRSSAAYRVRLALNLKGIPYTTLAVDLLNAEHQTAQFRSRNPQALLPALELDDGRVLNQSTAILEWLEESFPEHPLLPANPAERAEVRSLCSHIACDIHPLNNLSVMNYLRQEMAVPRDLARQWYGHWIHRGFANIETALRSGAGHFCHGDSPGLAECYLIPQVFNARSSKVDISDYPLIAAIDHRCNELRAFQNAHPHQQPDFKS